MAIGHGVSPSGTYQPGAAHRGIIEHDWAARAVYWCQKALERCGVRDVYYEHDGGEGHQRDPNYSGSIRKARALDVKWAVELHMNAGGGTGSETLYHPGHMPSNKLATWVEKGIVSRIKLRDRGVKAVRGHAFTGSLAADGRASVIVEGAFVDGDFAFLQKMGKDPFAWKYGEGVAAGVCAFLNVPWVPPKSAASPPKPAPSQKRIVYVVNGLNGRQLSVAYDPDDLWNETARDYLVKNGGLGSWYTKQEG